MILHCGDCMEILPTLAEASVDIVITDPPYINVNGGYERDYQGGVGRKHTISKCVTDPWGASLDWMAEAWRVARFGMMVFCTFHSVCQVGSLLTNAKKMVLFTWYKRNAAPTGKNVPRYTTEFIWGLGKSPGLKWDAFTTTMFDIPNINPGCMANERLVDENLCALHPAQKPIALMERLLNCEPESVLDPFMGTGTTGIACVRRGIDFIGIELDQNYFNMAKERIDGAQKQLPLGI